MKNKIIKIIEIVLVVCIIFSGYKIFDYYKSNKEFEKDNSIYKELVENSEDKLKNGELDLANSDDSSDKEAFQSEKSIKRRKIDELNKRIVYDPSFVKSLNDSYKNVIGRIIIEGTDIDFPIVQGQDNDFYLDHNYKNEYHVFGAIFMDYRNSIDFSDLNTVLYGHNVRSGHVFNDLVKYNDENVVNGQPYIIVDTLNERKIYEIYAVYSTSAYTDYRKPFYEGEALDNFLARINEANKLSKTIEKTDDLSILTLSTCSDEDDRLAIHAVEVK